MNRNRLLGSFARTKVRPPMVRPGLIQRPRLTDAFAEGLHPALTVVSGPSGSGKTMAVCQWLDARASASAWVSLDPDDDDPRTFWRLVAAALTETTAIRLPETSLLLDEPGADLSLETVPTLINELLEIEDQVVLVLDDFHLVSSENVLAQMSTLIDRRPSMLRIVLITRNALGLPLARWRAHRDLVEIGPERLSLDESEVRSLMRSLRPGIDDQTVARVAADTEGWVAGVQLATIALDRSSATALVNELIVEDVLARESPATVDFLCDVSILDELTADLCDAVSGRADSKEIIPNLERRNLFLARVESAEPTWRLHALFREALRVELEARADPSDVARLHRRVADWASDHGDWKMSARYLRLAGDPAAVVATLERSWLGALNEGEFEQFEREANKVPSDRVDASADLLIAMAFTALNLGRLDEARRRIDRCERIATPNAAGGIALVRSHYHRHVGDVPSAAQHARLALRSLGNGDQAGEAAASAAYGECLYWLGEEECINHLTVAIDRGHESGEHTSAIAGHVFLSAWHADRSSDDLASIHVEDARELAAAHDLDQRHHLAMASVAESQLAARQGNLEAAELALDRGITLARHGREPLAQIAAWLELARLRHWAGHAEGASSALAEAEKIRHSCVSPGWLTDEISRTRRSLAAPNHMQGQSRLIEPLTSRETTMLGMLRGDLTQREIANHMFISFNTARTHTKAIYRKLGVSSRAEAVAAAADQELF